MGTGATDAVAASRVWKLNPGLSQNQLMLLATEPAVRRRWELLCFVFEMTQCNGKGCVLYNGQQRECFIEIILQSKRINKSEDNSKVLNFYFFFLLYVHRGWELSECNRRELLLSFQNVGPRNQVQTVRLGTFTG